MAGPERHRLSINDNIVEITAWPASFWRLVPLWGILVMFSIGRVLAFQIKLKLIKRGDSDLPTMMQQPIALIANGKERERDCLDIPLPQKVGEKTSVKTDGFGLHFTGDGEIKLLGSWVCTLYSFNVKETAGEALNLILILLAASVSATVGAIATWLITGR